MGRYSESLFYLLFLGKVKIQLSIGTRQQREKNSN